LHATRRAIKKKHQPTAAINHSPQTAKSQSIHDQLLCFQGTST